MFESFFDFSYARLADPLLRGMRRAVADFAGNGPGQSILDVCCGTGAQAFEYARRGMEANGIDIDPRMLRQAIYYQTRLPQLKPVFIAGDATAMPFEDGSFDAASISLALHEKGPGLQDVILQEMRRVVKPGGTLVFADFRAPMPRSPIGLGIMMVEYAVGEENRRCFREYLSAGGLPAILKRSCLKVAKEEQVVANTVSLLTASNHAGCQGTPLL